MYAVSLKSLISLNIPSHTYTTWNKDQLCIISATPDTQTAGIFFHFTFLISVERISVTLRSRTVNLQISISTMLVIDMPADFVIIPKKSWPQSTAWDRISSKSRTSRFNAEILQLHVIIKEWSKTLRRLQYVTSSDDLHNFFWCMTVLYFACHTGGWLWQKQLSRLEHLHKYSTLVELSILCSGKTLAFLQLYRPH